MPSIAPLDTMSNALDTAAKFVRLVGNEGVTSEQFRLPIDDVTARRNLAMFLKNNCQFVIKGPSALVIDRATPFDPVKFIGASWKVVEEDKRALTLTTVDFSSVRFESGLKEGEQIIDGEEKLKRLKRLGIRLDAKCGQTLYEEKGQTTLRFLHDTFGLKWMEFAGTVLQNPGGDRCFLYLVRDDCGLWFWSFSWLASARFRGRVSPLLAS